MADTALPLEEFDQEMATTRKVLERIPSEKGPWKPHQKSFPLGHLAQLVAMMPGWITSHLRESHIDLAGGSGYTFEKTETLLSMFDRNVKEARQALSKVTGETLEESWSLKHGDQVLFSMRRGEAARNTLRHLIHHRGQLTVYIRMLDVPVPSIYGPTADEQWSPPQ